MFSNGIWRPALRSQTQQRKSNRKLLDKNWKNWIDQVGKESKSLKTRQRRRWIASSIEIRWKNIDLWRQNGQVAFVNRATHSKNVQHQYFHEEILQSTSFSIIVIIIINMKTKQKQKKEEKRPEKEKLNAKMGFFSVALRSQMQSAHHNW